MSQFASRRVIVPVDFSERSGKTAKWVSDELDATGELIVVHVLPPLAPHEPGNLVGAVSDAKRIQHATGYLSNWLGERGVGAHTPVVRIGTAARRITELADEQDGDIIVIAAASDPSERVFPLSHTTERVLRRAPCPVWVDR